jgi:hypothetical protein
MLRRDFVGRRGGRLKIRAYYDRAVISDGSARNIAPRQQFELALKLGADLLGKGKAICGGTGAARGSCQAGSRSGRPLWVCGYVAMPAFDGRPPCRFDQGDARAWRRHIGVSRSPTCHLRITLAPQAGFRRPGGPMLSPVHSVSVRAMTRRLMLRGGSDHDYLSTPATLAGRRS